jgi:hypothetical protein
MIIAMADEQRQRIRLNVEVTKDLWRRAKLRALDTDKDLRDVVIEALEALLAKPPKRSPR